MAQRSFMKEELSADTSEPGRNPVVNHISTIETPQLKKPSKKPLKRKVPKKKTADTETNPLATDRLSQWLQLLPEPQTLPDPMVHSRSDNFLHTISSRPPIDTRPSKRYKGVSMEPRNCSRQPGIPAPTSSDTPESLRDPQTPTPSTSRTSSRITRTGYRQNLRMNNIYIDPTRESMKEHSAAVIQHATKILDVPRTSPGLTDEKAQTASNHMRSIYHEGDREAVKDGYLDFDIVPPPIKLPKGIVRGGNRPFDMIGLPRIPLAPPLVRSRPDQHYDFNDDKFSIEQKYKNMAFSLRHHSAPSDVGYWPFFTIEFKSQATGGTLWVAENQIATSGALLTYSTQQLFAMSKREHKPIDSMIFSCTMDAKNVVIWASYCVEEEDEQQEDSVEDEQQDGVQDKQLSGRARHKFGCVEIRKYAMDNPKDIIACRSAIRNIFRWAVSSRLPKLKSALNAITIEVLDAKDKALRVHASDTIETGSH